jgi:hypothetical protein
MAAGLAAIYQHQNTRYTHFVKKVKPAADDKSSGGI